MDATKTDAPGPMSEAPERRAALDTAVREIRRHFGPGAVMRLGDPRPAKAIAVLPTGFADLDQALGVGGLPRGRIVELLDDEGAANRTLALRAVAMVQQRGGIASIVDVAQSLSLSEAQALGVSAKELLVSQLEDRDEALALVLRLVRTGAVDLIVVDSVGALVAAATPEGEGGAPRGPHLSQRVVQTFRQLAGAVARSGTCVVFLSGRGTGAGISSTDGVSTALRFYASVRVVLRRAPDTPSAECVRATIVKNKLAPPFQEAGLVLSPAACTGGPRGGAGAADDPPSSPGAGNGTQ